MKAIITFGLLALASVWFAIAQSSPLEVVDVREWMPDVAIASQYSNSDNFFQQKLYGVDEGTAYGTLGAIKDLQKVRSDLVAQGYDIKIWDTLVAK